MPPGKNILDTINITPRSETTLIPQQTEKSIALTPYHKDMQMSQQTQMTLLKLLSRVFSIHIYSSNFLMITIL
jgi:hypothetical protein